MHFETKSIHSGQKYDPSTGSAITPIHQNVSFQFESAAQAADRFSLDEFGQIYARMGNPTVDQFEARMAELDGGVGALGLASGMTAIAYAIMNICKAGDNFVTSRNLYGGVSNLFMNIFKDYGIEARFVDHNNPENFKNAMDDKTKLFFGEVLPNPRLNIFPIEEVSKVAKEVGVPLIVDNTCATPALCRPIELGADIVVYSATKYLGGHANAMAGMVVDSGNFDWSKNPDRFPMMTQPDPSLHGIEWIKKFGKLAYIVKLRATMLRDFGGCLAPMNAYLMNQGLETLSLRMEKHCKNAKKVAEFLQNHPKVENTVYPSLATDGTKELAEKQFDNGYYGAMVGMDVKGGTEAGKKVVESLKMFYHVAHIGDVRSMAIHPASTTHSQIPAKEREKAGITDGYVRLCIGIEHADDIIADLSQALDKI
ncbi:MAG: O-acetylhomoserine aminocarboxypropyltransferase [Magnetococcales bacterium]|nr:O-acetylhomoserine aminocarboxypropyltransferase [Magnetococcales bacterium]